MRKLLYFLAFLFIACAACDSKNEPEAPPAPPKPEPISPKDSIRTLLSGIWSIDSVETFHYGMQPIGNEYVLIEYSKVRYSGTEQLKLEGSVLYRKENNETEFNRIGKSFFGMKNDTAYVYGHEYTKLDYGGYITYHNSNRRARIYKTEIQQGLYYKDSIISVHRKIKHLPI